jgi:hypothetical protein
MLSDVYLDSERIRLSWKLSPLFSISLDDDIAEELMALRCALSAESSLRPEAMGWTPPP